MLKLKKSVKQGYKENHICNTRWTYAPCRWKLLLHILIKVGKSISTLWKIVYGKQVAFVPLQAKSFAQYLNKLKCIFPMQGRLYMEIPGRHMPTASGNFCKTFVFTYFDWILELNKSCQYPLGSALVWSEK